MSFDNLPRYRSHKIVRAAAIVGLNMDNPGDADVALDIGGGVRMAIGVSKGVFGRGTPAIGDYLVVYDEDYVSWSPKRAFEGGYTPLDEGPNR